MTDDRFLISCGGVTERDGKSYTALRIFDLDSADLLTRQHIVESDHADTIADEWNQGDPIRDADIARARFSARIRQTKRDGHWLATLDKSGRVVAGSF
jgi:hypothetical protein